MEQKIHINTWWDLRHKQNTVMEVYALICSEAIGYREEAKKLKGCDKQVFESISNKLWQIAAAMENTKEINP